jgi:hypothetical protein
MAALGGVYEGIDGIRRFLTGVEDAASDFRMELDGVEGVDRKRVLAFLRNSSTGRASGIRLAWPQTNVYDLVDGKISHIRIFLYRDEALKAVGLEEYGSRRRLLLYELPAADSRRRRLTVNSRERRRIHSARYRDSRPSHRCLEGIAGGRRGVESKGERRDGVGVNSIKETK